MSDISHQGMEPGTPGDTKARGSHRDAPGAAIFAGHGAIVLVANSEDAEIERLSATLPADTLFVFFNKADRVLSKPFARDSVLVLRSGRKGPSVVLKSDLDSTVALFRPGSLKAIVQLRVADIETLLGPERFNGHGHQDLDLTTHFAETYPSHKTPSSGYAMALWLLSLAPGRRVILTGFSSVRSMRWVVFPVHAWTFEQLALRILVRQKRIEQHPHVDGGDRTLAAMRAQFPELSDTEIALASFEILTERLENTNLFLDRLWSMTRMSRGSYGLYERLRSLFRRNRT